MKLDVHSQVLDTARVRGILIPEPTRGNRLYAFPAGLQWPSEKLAREVSWPSNFDKDENKFGAETLTRC